MAQYTITLKSEEDYIILKKILKAFDGASIRPQSNRVTHVERSLKESREGKIIGPFNSSEEFIKDLLN